MSVRLAPRATRVLALFGLVLLLAAASEVGLRLVARARAPLGFDVGPSTGAYLAGFTDSEERPPTTSRWARNRARIELPLVAAAGPAQLALRFGRFVDHPVNVHVHVEGRPAGTLRATPGRQRVVRLPVTLAGGQPLTFDLASDDPGDLAIALDWLRIEGAALRPAPSLLAARLLAPGVLLIALLAGAGLRGASAAALLALGLELLFASADPFGAAHVLQRVTLPALAAAALAARLLRDRPRGQLAALAFLLSYLLKGAALFHPSYFYNDVRNNRRYVEALRDDPGTLAERSHAAQLRIGVAYPRIVAGRKYAFPYSPVFFLPFGLLPHDTTSVEEGLKHVTVACAAAEVLIVFLLAGRVFGPGTGALGALLAAFLPIQYSRLMLAMWSTVGGHVFDGLALLAACGWALAPHSRRALVSTWASVQASFLTYVASLFNMSLFSGFAALLVRPLRWRLLAIGAGSALLTVALLYFDFALLFVREILPAFLTAGGGAGSQPPPDRVTALLAALARIPLFYGWLYPPLVLAGFWLARRRAPAPVFHVLAAYGLGFVTLVLLRGLGGGLFKDLKEIEYVTPLVALCAGAALEELAARERAGRAAAALLTALLVAFGAWKAWTYFETWSRLAGLD
jgi:hypothetical protein